VNFDFKGDAKASLAGVLSSNSDGAKAVVDLGTGKDPTIAEPERQAEKQQAQPEALAQGGQIA
jgi:hypothetical protein